MILVKMKTVYFETLLNVTLLETFKHLNYKNSAITCSFHVQLIVKCVIESTYILTSMLAFATSEGWLSICDHWRIADCFRSLMTNLYLFYLLNFFVRLCLCDQSAVWWKVGIAQSQFPDEVSSKVCFSFHSFRVFLCRTIVVNGKRYFILKSHNMMLMSFTGKTLQEKLSFELCLQFSFCFF